MKTFAAALLAIVLFSQSVVAGIWLPEEQTGKSYWDTLDEKSKIVFLTGYRIGRGPAPSAEAKLEFRVLRADHFPELAKRVNAFYTDPANEKVFLSYAILISFMEMSEAPKAKLDEMLKEGRNPYFKL